MEKEEEDETKNAKGCTIGHKVTAGYCATFRCLLCFIFQ